MKSIEVLVLDQEKRFLEYIHPAIARRLVKEGKARVYCREPFVVQLTLEVSRQINSGLITLRGLVF